MKCRTGLQRRILPGAPGAFALPPQWARRIAPFASQSAARWPVITFDGLSKHYGAFIAVRGLTFMVAHG